MKKQKTITICSSVSFYKDIPPLYDQLSKMGYKVLLPDVADVMRLNKNYHHEKTWLTNKNDYHKKTKLMDEHFKKVIQADAILVVNYDKNGMKGYIGGNVLMEMVLAYHYKKPIFILNDIDEKLPLKEEVYGLNSIFLDRNLESIRHHLK